MWDISSRIMEQMHELLPRAAAQRIAHLGTVFPVTVVTGARQTGKSTLVRRTEVTGERLYLTMDDVLLRDQAEREPQALLERARRLVLDEVQRVPDLLIAV